MLSLDISFIFHLIFIIFACKMMKNLFFIPLYESIFLEIAHNKALKNAILEEIEKLDERERIYKKYQKEIIEELRNKLSLTYKEELSQDFSAVHLSMILAENESEESIQQVKNKLNDYASSIVKKIYL